MAEKACHAFGSTTQVGLTQALGLMKLDPNSEEYQKRLMALLEEMSGESDRAVAVVGAAWVEEALTEAINEFLEPHTEASKRLFNGSGPLATFSAKIDLARMLGIMSDEIRSDLHAIRHIRNEFAHHIAHKTDHTRLTFAAGHIRDKCVALRCVAYEEPSDPREAFTRACAILKSDLGMISFFGGKNLENARVFARGEA